MCCSAAGAGYAVRWAGWNKKPRADLARGFVLSRGSESAILATRFGRCSGRGFGREEHAGEDEAGANAGGGGEVEEHDRHVQQPVGDVETGEPDAEQDDAADYQKEEPHCCTDVVIHRLSPWFG